MSVFDLPFTPEQINEILDDYFTNVAKRQYQGARYVPVFGRKDETSVQWDNTAPYEPLTIVLHQGNSFTSRQYVPTGVDINNALYWAETGNYNGQVEAYRNEVLLFDSRMDAIEEDIADLEPRMTQAEDDIDGLEDRMTQAEGDIDSLEDRMTQAEGDIGGLRIDVDNHTSQIGADDAEHEGSILRRLGNDERWINANNIVANVKQFGAVGDGVTDDTDAIKAAVATGYDVYFPCLNNEIYVVVGFSHFIDGVEVQYTPIVLNHEDQTLYSDFQGRTIKFITDGENTVLFDVQRAAKIEGITVTHVQHTPNVVDEHGNVVEDHEHSGIAIKATTNLGRNDTDVLIERCGFSRFNKAVDYTGRGLYVARSQLTSCKTAIHLKWLHDDDPTHAVHMSNALGHRSHRILSNRFHSLAGADATAILLESNVPGNTDPLNGILISNNMFDYSGLYFIHATCSVRYAQITNNYLGFGTYYALWFESSIYNSVIADNCIWGDERFHQWRRAMQFDDSVVGCVISNNAISNCWTAGIYFTGQANSCSIVGNTFNGVTPRAIVCNSSWNRTVVLGNTGNLASGSTNFIGCLNSPSTYEWNHVKVAFNSVGNASTFINTVPPGTDTVTVYNYGDDV